MFRFRGKRLSFVAIAVRLRRLLARPGSSRYCLCCGRGSGRFLSAGDYAYNKRSDAKCPWCGSLERHRLLLHYLRSNRGAWTSRKTVLHFAPEIYLEGVFRSNPNWVYLTSDLHYRSMVKADLTNLSFPSNRFDLIICSHTLDHVPDDLKAMSEIFRVLKPGGLAIFQCLVDPESPLTRSGPPTGAPRREKGGECIRVYGTDLQDRLQSAGFAVEIREQGNYITGDRLVRWGLSAKDNPVLLRQNDLYLCRKIPR